MIYVQLMDERVKYPCVTEHVALATRSGCGCAPAMALETVMAKSPSSESVQVNLQQKKSVL